MFATIRMIIAEQLLGWAVDIVPENDDGALLTHYVKQYIEQAIERGI